MAKVNLEFINHVAATGVTTKWYRPFSIEMPLRTKDMGKISASLAADLRVEITEGVARDMNYDNLSGIFCFRRAAPRRGVSGSWQVGSTGS